MLRPQALDHVALKGTDRDKTLHFYHQVLGLELVRTSGPHAAGGRTAALKVGGQELNVFSQPALVLVDKAHGGGVDHCCLTMAATSDDALIAD